MRRGPKPGNVVDRLLAGRRITPAGCWEWTGTRRAGYGRIRVAGRLGSVHRVAWEVFRGPIPEGRLVLHRCDNPPCFNPADLFLGTPAVNSADMSSKGRGAGRPHPRNFVPH